MEKQMEIDENPTFAKGVESFFHRVICLIFRVMVTWIYGKKGKSMPPINDLVLLESASSLAHKIRCKKITSVAVVQSFIDRIKEVNPLLNCVVDERFKAALMDAEEADSLIASSKYTEEELEQQKPFLGVPITTKDCIMVKDLLHTAGIYKRRNIRATEDSEAIALMRKSGAIPLALTNVSECCMWWESHNIIHGRTNNPYDTNRIVGGSSGGEGCIQASAASPFGLGSDIGGSIRMPAYFNGIFGHKPSKYAVSIHGQFPSPSHDEQKSFLSIGPMSRFATDLKPILKIIADKNAAKLRLDEPVDLSKINIFYQVDDCGGHMMSRVDSDIKESMEKVAKYFKKTVKANVTKVELKRFKKSTIIWMGNMKAENEPDFDELLDNLEGRISPYWELLKSCFGQSNHTFIGILTGLMERAGVQYGSSKYKYLVEQRNELAREITEMLGTNGILLYPTHPTAAPYHNEPVVRPFNFSYTGIINVMGFPATAIPLGLGREGLPIGLQAIGGLNQDRLCLAVACELERAFGGWVPPKITA